MKTAVKEEQMTPWKVKDLPGTGMIDTVCEAVVRPNLTRLRLDRNGVLSLEIKAWDWMNTQPTAPVLDPSGVPLEAIRDTATLDRVERLMLREITSIRQLGADSLTVVLKPDARTELVLQLQQRDGRLEAFVRCDAQAFDRFQRDWPQLQESLAQLNVRLLPLKENPSSDYPQQQGNRGDAGGSAGDAPDRQHPGERRGSREEAVAHLDSVTSEAAPRRRGTQARRPLVGGWESWA
jgi:hypothetical protein